MVIRDETPADIVVVQTLTEAAFAPMSFSNGTEALALAGLREADDLRLSLVAETDGQVVGHVAFSDVLLNGEPSKWVGLGPIAVRRELQKQGIGTALVNAGAKRLSDEGAFGMVLIGNPMVYGPMDFVSDDRLSYRDLPTRLVQYRAFGDRVPEGEITFAPALG